MLTQPAVMVATIKPIVADLLSLSEKQERVLLLIGGDQHVGKSWLARKLAKRLRKEGIPVTAFPMDPYLMGLNRTPQGRQVTIMENVGAVKYEDDSNRLFAGEDIYPSGYNPQTRMHVWGKRKALSFPGGVLILDGLLLLAIEGLREKADMRVFVKIPEETRLKWVYRCNRGFRGLSPETTRAKLRTVEERESPKARSLIDYAHYVYIPDPQTLPELVDCIH